jgi:class 3 adenylate cyclase
LCLQCSIEQRFISDWVTLVAYLIALCMTASWSVLSQSPIGHVSSLLLVMLVYAFPTAFHLPPRMAPHLFVATGVIAVAIATALSISTSTTFDGLFFFVQLFLFSAATFIPLRREFQHNQKSLRTCASLEMDSHTQLMLLERVIPRVFLPDLIRGARIASSGENVSVLFCEVMVPSSASKSMYKLGNNTQSETLDLLNNVFRTLDSVVERNVVFKVETIGSEYMVVSGLPSYCSHPNSTAFALIRTAMSMLSVVGNSEELQKRGVSLQIGINSGTCVESVLGRKLLPRWKLFGDTVNTASRVKSSGGPGYIHISRETRDVLLRDIENVLDSIDPTIRVLAQETLDKLSIDATDAQSLFQPGMWQEWPSTVDSVNLKAAAPTMAEIHIGEDRCCPLGTTDIAPQWLDVVTAKLLGIVMVPRPTIWCKGKGLMQTFVVDASAASMTGVKWGMHDPVPWIDSLHNILMRLEMASSPERVSLDRPGGRKGKGGSVAAFAVVQNQLLSRVALSLHVDEQKRFALSLATVRTHRIPIKRHSPSRAPSHSSNMDRPSRAMLARSKTHASLLAGDVSVKALTAASSSPELLLRPSRSTQKAFWPHKVTEQDSLDVSIVPTESSDIDGRPSTSNAGGPDIPKSEPSSVVFVASMSTPGPTVPTPILSKFGMSFVGEEAFLEVIFRALSIKLTRPTYYFGVLIICSQFSVLVYHWLPPSAMSWRWLIPLLAVCAFVVIGVAARHAPSVSCSCRWFHRVRRVVSATTAGTDTTDLLRIFGDMVDLDTSAGMTVVESWNRAHAWVQTGTTVILMSQSALMLLVLVFASGHPPSIGDLVQLATSQVLAVVIAASMMGLSMSNLWWSAPVIGIACFSVTLFSGAFQWFYVAIWIVLNSGLSLVLLGNAERMRRVDFFSDAIAREGKRATQRMLHAMLPPSIMDDMLSSEVSIDIQLGTAAEKDPVHRLLGVSPKPAKVVPVVDDEMFEAAPAAAAEAKRGPGTTGQQRRSMAVAGVGVPDDVASCVDSMDEPCISLSLPPAAGDLSGSQPVSILMFDLVGFTKLATDIGPNRIVSMLDDLYYMFDTLVERRGAYKVETIGDAFLVCCGALTPLPPQEAAINIAKCAVDMVQRVKTFRAPGGRTLQARVGIHAGHVLTGIIGKQMPRYQLFGEAVDVAMEMEASSKPGKVRASAAMVKLLQGVPDLTLERPYLSDGSTFVSRNRAARIHAAW